MAEFSTQKLLAQKKLSSTGDNLVYTCPNSYTRTYIKTIIICNTTAASKTYSLWINPNGTASADQFAFAVNRTIAANATDQFIYPGDAAIILFGSSASIIMGAGTSNTLTVTLFGIEIVET